MKTYTVIAKMVDQEGWTTTELEFEGTWAGVVCDYPTSGFYAEGCGQWEIGQAIELGEVTFV